MSASAGDARSGLSIAERVRRYVDARPVVRSALARDLVNLSELTRQIAADTDIQGKHAILAACRRYKADLDPEPYGAPIREALEEARLDIRTQVESLTLRGVRREHLEAALGALEGKPFHVIGGEDRCTVVTDPDQARRVRQVLPEGTLARTREGLAEARITASRALDEVPGFTNFVTSSLVQRGVHPLHVVSGPRSVALVFEPDDLTATVEVLDPLVGR